VFPTAEKSLIPGFGCMITKSWYEAYRKRHFRLMVEIARTNMQRYGDKVTEAQSKASLLLMLGYSLAKTAELEATEEGNKHNREALKLIRSLDKRSAHEIVFGVWPEACVFGWDHFLLHRDASDQNREMEWIQEMINLTRRTINSLLADAFEQLSFFSISHYEVELGAIGGLSLCFSFLSEEEDTEKWLTIFGKRLEEIETLVEREGWDLTRVKQTKFTLVKSKGDLYQRQGKLELALDVVNKALKEGEDNASLNILIPYHAELCLKTGRIEEALKSMEKIFSSSRSEGNKPLAVYAFGALIACVPEESQSQFEEFIWQYPHVIWAANAAGCVELSKEENKDLRSQLETKKGSYCINCSKELTKVYRCSRCDLATYCGSTCQKEAWKEHKKICKKREEKE
jgi:tetratricopeptide (TPR) repeat protein